MRKHLWQRVTKAIKRFNLISDGDRIGVGLSGGKDSATLLFVLSALTKRAPVSFEVVGLHVDCGFGTDMRPLEALCERVGVGLQVSEAPIALALKNRPDKASACSSAQTSEAVRSTLLQRAVDATRSRSATIRTMLWRLSCYA